ncbi:MAG: hypothetical protein HZY75_14895 [Nocardioidaceae bacterium]|nr:MAG: hypothetical protein HZY75_14895 [Nocardioidaceae bacterium]
MRTAITAGVARATGWLVVVAVALATTIGLINRIFTPADAPYFLLTREVAAHPWASLGLLVVSFGAYGWVFRKLCGLLAGWRDGVHTHPPRGPRTATLVRFLDWMFSSWWRIALVLAVCWLPWYLTSYPGQPNPDFARMLEEFLLTRPDTVGATPAYENYPTSFYLLPGGDSLWSNHHNFFLMLYYGSVSKLSITLFGTVMPAIYALSTVTLILTLVAFGRAFAILGRFVTDWKIRGIGFGLVVFSPLIALWSMSHSKNQLFAAGFAWWLALLAEYLHAERRMLRRWYVEMVLVGVLITASVLFGWILLVCQAIAMLFLRRGWRGPLTAMAVPALVVHGAVVVLVSMGTVIPSDPIETKGLQLQQLTLILKEHPDALSAQDRAALSRIFDTDVMVEVFDPDSSDPVKSTGPFIRKTDSYQYKTVQPQDWDAFNGIYLRAALKYPGTFLDGLVLKTYRYLDPLDKGTTWYPAWQPITIARSVTTGLRR